MDVFETMRMRHSYRGEFEPTAIPREDLRRIVEAGLIAPSGCNQQSTTFVIVDDAALLKKFAALIEKPYTKTAAAMIVCVIDPTPAYGDTEFSAEDCAAAVENMLLATTALGYATVWLDGYLRSEGRAEAMAQLLSVPDGKTVRVLLPIGVPKEVKTQPEKKPFEERAWFNEHKK